LEHIDADLNVNLTDLGVASDSPLAVALKSIVVARAHAPATAATASNGATSQHAESVSDMKSKLFHMEAAGFTDGAFCKKRGGGHGGGHGIGSQPYEIVAVTEAGMEISKWADGARAIESEWVDAQDALSKWVVAKGVQELVKVTAPMLPTNKMAVEGSKAAAMLGMLNKAKKYTASNHAGLDLLNRPTAVMTKRKFDAMELKIVELTLTRRAQHRRGQSGWSPTVHANSRDVLRMCTGRMPTQISEQSCCDGYGI